MKKKPTTPPPEPTPVDLGSPSCVTEGCGKERKWKGLCSSCYGQARHLIDSNRTTWDELEELKLIIPDDKPFILQFKRVKGLL